MRLNLTTVFIDHYTYGKVGDFGVVVNDSKDPNKISVLAEGVETAMSLKTVLPNDQIIVTLGKSNFKNIDPNRLAETVLICLDNDTKNPVEDKTIRATIDHLRAAGKEVIMTMPRLTDDDVKRATKQDDLKKDMNDVLKEGGKEAVRNLLKQDLEINNALKDPNKAIEAIAEKAQLAIKSINLDELFKNKVQQYTEANNQKMRDILKIQQMSQKSYQQVREPSIPTIIKGREI